MPPPAVTVFRLLYKMPQKSMQPTFIPGTGHDFCLMCDLLSTVIIRFVSSLHVVDSRIQRIVLATEETTVTQQVSHRPIKCQSRLWSQRDTKVNGSHRGDNPLLRPTGIQIATKKLCGSTSNGTDQYQNGSSNLLPLYREQARSTRNVVAYPRPTFSAKKTEKLRKNYGKITLQPVLINKSKILKATHCTEIRENERPRSMVVEALSW